MFELRRDGQLEQDIRKAVNDLINMLIDYLVGFVMTVMDRIGQAVAGVLDLLRLFEVVAAAGDMPEIPDSRLDPLVTDRLANGPDPVFAEIAREVRAGRMTLRDAALSPAYRETFTAMAQRAMRVTAEHSPAEIAEAGAANSVAARTARLTAEPPPPTRATCRTRRRRRNTGQLHGRPAGDRPHEHAVTAGTPAASRMTGRAATVSAPGTPSAEALRTRVRRRAVPTRCSGARFPGRWVAPRQ